MVIETFERLILSGIGSSDVSFKNRRGMFAPPMPLSAPKYCVINSRPKITHHRIGTKHIYLFRSKWPKKNVFSEGLVPSSQRRKMPKYKMPHISDFVIFHRKIMVAMETTIKIVFKKLSNGNK